MIQEKLTILLESNTINQKAFDYAQTVLDYLREKEIIKEDEEADVLITHLAMAASRQGTEEIIVSVDENVKQEIEADENYEKAAIIWNELKKVAPITFSSNEDGYIHLHLVTLLQEN